MKKILSIVIICLLESCEYSSKINQEKSISSLVTDTCEIDDATKKLLDKANIDAFHFINEIKFNASTIYVLNRPILNYMPENKREGFIQDLSLFLKDSTQCAPIYDCLVFDRIGKSMVCDEVANIIQQNGE
jgi:hypothetical protein